MTSRGEALLTDAYGGVSEKPRIDIPDRVNFSYKGNTPLVYDRRQCTELTRQIRGGPRDVPPVNDLIFKDAYLDAARTRKLVSVLSHQIDHYLLV